MKAALLTKYTKENLDLKISEIEKPQPQANEVLIKISAAGVNPVDNMITRGEVKLITPYKLPLIAGNEAVGIIEKLGSDVANFEVGSRVFVKFPLANPGAFAEYAVVPESAIAKVPAYLTDEEAASVPLTALTVMQAFDLMNVEAGKTIFISGGTGGVGNMAIPIAKAKGLTVITSGSTANKERVLNLGVDQFIDYKTEDYTKVLANIDYVLDTLGGEETEKQFSILKAGGHLVSLRAMPNGAFAERMKLSFLKRMLFKLAGKKIDKLAAKYNLKYDFVYVEANGGQLQEVANILEKAAVKPSLDTVFNFEDINKALSKVAAGHAKGKTVIKF